MNSCGLSRNWSLVLHHCYSNCVGERTVKGCRKESSNSIRQNRYDIATTLSSNPQTASGRRACGKRRKWQYAPWSLLSVGESSCRRKNLTSCFRGPHFCRCSYIMCSKGIARSEEAAAGKTEEKKRSLLRTCFTATWIKHFNLYQDHQKKSKNYNLLFYMLVVCCENFFSSSLFYSISQNW